MTNPISVRKPAVVLTALLMCSALAWSLAGGIDTAQGQTGSPATEIHRAHTGAFSPEPNRPVFILALGSDAGARRYGRGGKQENGRADSIHIIGINPQRNGASIVGIPRDSYVSIPGHGKQKINAAMFFGGPKLMIQTVEALAGVRFDYYMLTNFQDLADMGTEFGGLPINVPYPMSDKQSKAFFKAGVQNLNGPQILAFSRNRHDAPKGDFDRSLNQGSVMVAAQAKAKKDATADPTKVLSYLRIVRRHVATDIPLIDCLRLGLLAMRLDTASIKNRVLPGTTGATPAGSSVLLGAPAMAMLHDQADDGLLSS
jgi:LCP family protein required for cell wall assembly